MEVSQHDISAGLSILCLGRTDRVEFRELLPSLEAWGTVLAAATVAEATDRLDPMSFSPDLIVVAQSYPDEFSATRIEPLRRQWPLTRMIALLGAWCEGETRTGNAWPGAVRVFWHQWASRCALELSRMLKGRASIWSLPSTASAQERCLALARRTETCDTGDVAIVTRQFDVYEWLAEACRRRGYQPHWGRPRDERPVRSPKFILLDAAREPAEDLALARRLRSGANAPMVVLTDFPRCRDRDRFLAAGARAVLSRPFFWDDLFHHFTAE